MKMLEMIVSGLEVQISMSINILINKLEKLNADLDAMVTEKMTTNLIVGNVLIYAAQAMGLEHGVKDFLRATRTMTRIPV
jgi:hypothetical protein